MTNNITARYGSKGAKQVTGEIRSVHDAFTRLQKQGAKGFGVGVGATVTAKAFNLVGQAAGKVEDIIKDSTQAYIDDQRSIQRLTSSLRANIAGWDGQTDAIENVLKARLKLGFSDDEQRDSLAKLVAATHDVSKALDIERVAMDLARFKGISLADAGDALTKVEAGSYRILKSLGIQLSDNATQTEALAAVEKVAAGQAADFAQTIDGKLTVAQVKAHEAEEKLGKGFAELEASILPPLADAITDITNQTDALNEAQRRLGQGVPHDELVDYARSLMDLPVQQGYVKSSMGSLRDMMSNAGERAGKLADDLETHLTPALKNAKQPGKGLAGVLHDMGYQAGQADDAIGDLSSTISDDLFGDAINAGNLAELQQTHAELVKQRKAAKDGSREWTILTGKIAENEQAQFDLQLQMAQEEGPAAVIAFLDKAKEKYGKNNKVIQTEIDKLEKLYGLLNKFDDLGVITFGRYSGKSIPGFAGGVKNFGGGMAVVGEQGPEVVNLPKGSDVYPTGTGPAMGGNVNLTINVSGVTAMTPGSAQELGRILTPVIARAMQQRGMLAGARAF